MHKTSIWIALSLCSGISASAANAQFYEAIKSCKKSIKVIIACVVVEKGAESWWEYYYHKGGEKTPADPPERSRIGSLPDEVKQVEQGGKKTPDLLNDLGYIKPGDIHLHWDPTQGLVPCVLQKGGCGRSDDGGK